MNKAVAKGMKYMAARAPADFAGFEFMNHDGTVAFRLSRTEMERNTAEELTRLIKFRLNKYCLPEDER